MRLFSILSLAVAALAQDYEYDELGNKKNNVSKNYIEHNIKDLLE